MADEKFYYYRPKATRDEIDKAKKENRAVNEPKGRLLTSLDNLHAKFKDAYPTVEEFASEVLDSPAAQRMGGFELREATEEDVKAYAPSISVYKAYGDYNGADKVRDKTRLDAQKKVVAFLSENIENKTELADFIESHDTDNRRLTSFMRAVYKAEGTVPSNTFLKAFGDYLNSRKKDTDKVDYTAEWVRSDIVTPPKKADKKTATAEQIAKEENDAENEAKGKTEDSEEPKAA
jgi:hypothetical protein